MTVVGVIRTSATSGCPDATKVAKAWKGLSGSERIEWARTANPELVVALVNLLGHRRAHAS